MSAATKRRRRGRPARVATRALLAERRRSRLQARTATRGHLAERRRKRLRASTPAPAVTRPVAPVPTVPRQQPRARSRRSTVARRPAAKSGTDDGEGGPRVHVELGPVDHEACRRLARLLVERAVADVLGPKHSDAAGATNTDGAREKVL